MAIKCYFVYDKETGYILSGYECCSDDRADGYNVFNRPYKIKEYYPIDEKCRLDYIYNSSKRSGLRNLKKENLTVAVADHLYDVKSNFVENPDYFYARCAARGWWKLDFNASKINTLQ